MKGTDVTEEQLSHAREFLNRTQVSTPDGLHEMVAIKHLDLIRLLAWYGAIRAKSGKYSPRSLVAISDRSRG